MTECPYEAPYFRKQSKTFSLTDKSTKNIYTCLSSCSGSENIIEYTNECVTSCPSGYTLKSSIKKCFVDCSSKYFDPVDNQCVSSCSKYYEKSLVNGNFICKLTCSANNKYVKEKECVNSCSSGDFIGKDNICKTSCDATTDGSYFLDIGGSIYKCLFSCPAVDYIFYTKVSGNNLYQCLNKCPSNGNYYVI